MKTVFFPDHTKAEAYLIPCFTLLFAIASAFAKDWAIGAFGLGFLLCSFVLSIAFRTQGLYVDDVAIAFGDFFRKKLIRWDEIERIKLRDYQIHLAARDRKGRARKLVVKIYYEKGRTDKRLQKVELISKYLSPYFEFDLESVLSREKETSQTSLDLVPTKIIERRLFWRIYAYSFIGLGVAAGAWIFMQPERFDISKTNIALMGFGAMLYPCAVYLPQALWMRNREDRLARVYGYERLGWRMRRRDGGGDDSQEIPWVARDGNGG